MTARGEKQRSYPLTDTEKQQIHELWDNGQGARAIARELQRSPHTINNYCKTAGLHFDTTRTRAASDARYERLREQRLTMAEKLIDDMAAMRMRVWDEYAIVANSPEGAEIIQLDEPPLKEQADGYKAIEAMQRTVKSLMEGLDIDGETEAKSVLAKLQDGLQNLIRKDPTAGLGERDQDSDYDVKDHLDD